MRFRTLVIIALLSLLSYTCTSSSSTPDTTAAGVSAYGVSGAPTSGSGGMAGYTDIPISDSSTMDSENVPDGKSTLASGGTPGASGTPAGGSGGLDTMDSGMIDGGGGTNGAAGSGGTSGSGGTTITSGAEPPIPPTPAQCPTIATGMIEVLGQQVQLWVGPAGQPGPMVFYWHGTGSVPTEAVSGLGPGLAEIQSTGGVVASFTTTTGNGSDTGNSVWFTGDFEMADVVLACAVEQGFVDTRQIFAAGCSAGGLQATAMVYQRSSYLAGAMPNSGGNAWPNVAVLQDPSHVPAAITTHGAAGVDVVGMDFASGTALFTADISAKGGFVVDCDHGGNHCRSPADVKAAQWEFLKAHPFGFETSPYANGLPAHFPSFCQIIN